jgi:hypothetical protein
MLAPHLNLCPSVLYVCVCVLPCVKDWACHPLKESYHGEVSKAVFFQNS